MILSLSTLISDLWAQLFTAAQPFVLEHGKAAAAIVVFLIGVGLLDTAFQDWRHMRNRRGIGE